jgi:hypothetical protein
MCNNGITYKTSLMRTHATGYGREDMNIEDIHCQIVMRMQRNKQLLRELEGGPSEQADNMYLNVYDQGAGDTTDPHRQSSYKKQPHEKSVIIVKEQEELGPDYCSKKPVFLAIHFPEVGQQPVPVASPKPPSSGKPLANPH